MSEENKVKRTDSLVNPSVALEKKLTEWTFGAYMGLLALLGVLLPKWEFTTNGALQATADFIISLCGFLLVNKLVHYIYSHVIFSRKEKDLMLAGEWYHVHIPNEGVYGSSVRAGTTLIKQNYYELMFDGSNDDFMLMPDGKVAAPASSRHTQWHYDSVSLNKDEMLILAAFTARSDDNAVIKYTDCPFCHMHYDEPHEVGVRDKVRGGMHELRILPKGSEICNAGLQGWYKDLYPSHSSGHIYFFRVKADRDAFIKRELLLAAGQKAVQKSDKEVSA